jgi:DMSO/TMAO reductase YedYZ molybdopterin-dependent catalytic subunit
MFTHPRTLCAVTALTPADAELPPEDHPVGRRALLGMLGLGAAGILWGAKAQSGLDRLLRPITLNDQTGLTSFLPSSGRFRIYSVTGGLPSRSDAEYRLAVDGHVDRPATLELTDLREHLPQTGLTRDFQCVTGWRVEDVAWKGVRLSDLLDEVGTRAGATHVRFWSFDGVYTETLTMEQARRDDVMVAHHMLGKPVTREHGGPVRLYVAPMYGYKSLKWLERVEVVTALDEPSDPGYWERLGYDVDAWVGGSNQRDDAPT